ncbi:MAG: hypothetical protein IPK59_18915 [Rhodospirillaceae bacterium]|nr:hypothetical protein [Rhodospirillaceae bacterium]
MARRPSRKKYAETIGEIAIGWNLLERRVDVVGFHYLGGKAEVASRIFQSMGNQTKEEFFRYLVKKIEPDARISECVNHLLSATSILRENRNTILHASPAINPITATPRYEGRIFKTHKLGHSSHFNVSIEVLEEIVFNLKNFADYAAIISASLESEDNDGLKQGPSTKEAMTLALSTLKTKLPLPYKIASLPLPEDPLGAKPRPKPSRGSPPKEPPRPKKLSSAQKRALLAKGKAS